MFLPKKLCKIGIKMRILISSSLNEKETQQMAYGTHNIYIKTANKNVTRKLNEF